MSDAVPKRAGGSRATSPSQLVVGSTARTARVILERAWVSASDLLPRMASSRAHLGSSTRPFAAPRRAPTVGARATRAPRGAPPSRDASAFSRLPILPPRRSPAPPPRALPPSSVEKLMQQWQRSRDNPAADAASAPETPSPSAGAKTTVSSKKQNRWLRISRLAADGGPDASRGLSRINTYATAEQYSLSELADRIRLSRGTWSDPEVLDNESLGSRLLSSSSSSAADASGAGDPTEQKIAFFFDYGAVVFWGLEPHEEQSAMRELMSSCEIEPLSLSAVELDSMFFAFGEPGEEPEMPSPSPSFRSVDEDGAGGGADSSPGASPANAPSSSSSARALVEDRERTFSRVADDVVIIPPAQAGDAALMLAASHALAQSTKLALYEERASRLADETEEIPREMARSGEVGLTMREATRLRGQIFMQRADLNLASTILDVPDFFWGAPDRYSRLYEEMRVYLEMDTRVEVLNSRLGVLESLAQAVSDELESKNGTRLEWIVIWLIVIEVVIGLVEIWGITGLHE